MSIVIYVVSHIANDLMPVGKQLYSPRLQAPFDRSSSMYTKVYMLVISSTLGESIMSILAFFPKSRQNPQISSQHIF